MPTANQNRILIGKPGVQETDLSRIESGTQKQSSFGRDGARPSIKCRFLLHHRFPSGFAVHLVHPILSIPDSTTSWSPGFQIH